MVQAGDTVWMWRSDNVLPFTIRYVTTSQVAIQRDGVSERETYWRGRDQEGQDFFLTWEACRAWAVERIEQVITRLERTIQYNQTRIARYKALTEPVETGAL